MDHKETENVKMDTEELDETAGGDIRLYYELMHPKYCMHPDRQWTGNQRTNEKFFWTVLEYEYTCPKCGKTFWGAAKSE